MSAVNFVDWNVRNVKNTSDFTSAAGKLVFKTGPI